MKRYFILITITMLMPLFIQAQGLADALRFSQVQLEGTARSGAMGNAFGALGGDFTSVSINPAGIGLYRSSEFTITPKSGNTSIESVYYNNSIEDSEYKFTLSNISYVSSIATSNTSEAGLISVNIGIGYNRLKDFNNRSIMAANGVDGSYLDYFADNANIGIWSDFYEELAWGSDLLIYDENNNEYFHDIQDAGYDQYQRKTVSKSGSIDEYSFAIGFNFNHKFYLGASLGITDLYYRESSQIYEEDVNSNIPYFNEFAFNSYLITSGYGSNVKIGAIFKPVNELRLGVSVHTPTFYRLNDLFDTRMESYITYDDGSETYNEYSPTNEYDYRLQTPFKATFSGAYLFAGKGLVSVDYEIVDYSNAKLSEGGDGNQFTDTNLDIAEAYSTVGNLRIGAEYRVNKSFYLRGGYEYQGSAFSDRAFGASQPNADAKLNVYSAGLGYTSGFVFFDVAFRHSVLDNYDLPYPTPGSNSFPAPQVASVNTIANNILFTFGYKF